jgi:hypothetical protein
MPYYLTRVSILYGLLASNKKPMIRLISVNRLTKEIIMNPDIKERFGAVIEEIEKLQGEIVEFGNGLALMDTDGRYHKELHDIIMDAVTAMGKFTAFINVFGLNLDHKQYPVEEQIEHPNIF